MKVANTLTHLGQDDRERQHAPLSLGLFLRLMGYTRQVSGKRNWLIMLVILRAMQLPALAWIFAAVINGPILHGDIPGIFWGAAGFLAFSVFLEICLHFRQRLALELGEHVVYQLRRDIFMHLQRMPMAFFHRVKLGRIISRMTSDAEAVRVGVQDVLFVSIVNGGQMFVAAAIMLWYDWVLFLLLLLIAPILWLINRYFSSRLGNAYRQIQESMSRVTATLAESVHGIRVTQGFVREDVNARMFRELVNDHSRHNMLAVRLTGQFVPLLELNSQFFISMLLVVGGYQVLIGGMFATHGQPELQLEAMLVFFFMVPQFFNPIQALGNQYNQALTSMAGAERVFRLLDQVPESYDEPDAVNLEQLEGEVCFDHVHFEYEVGKPVLRDVCFTAKPGQCFAFVGHTGSGKSTIINLIAKFYVPTEGSLRIDGHAIRQIQTPALMNHLGIVLQQNFLFTGTVMDNIRIGKLDATDQQIIEAARKLDCLDLLDALPDGLQTVVGEGGSGISLGQRQLVCFTRAMLANPRILILDEATSSVDTMTEVRIQKALSVLLQGRTSFIIAHRLSTIRHADQVLVLDQGQIIERGTHMQLLRKAGIYAELYRQFIRASESGG